MSGGATTIAARDARTTLAGQSRRAPLTLNDLRPSPSDASDEFVMLRASAVRQLLTLVNAHDANGAVAAVYRQRAERLARERNAT